MSEVRGVTGEDSYSYGQAGWHMVGPGSGFSTGQLTGYLVGYFGASTLVPYAGGFLWNRLGPQVTPTVPQWPHGDSHFSTSPGGGGPRDDPASTASPSSPEVPGSGGVQTAVLLAAGLQAIHKISKRAKSRCGYPSKQRPTRKCLNARGHSGRHRFF